MIIKDTFKLISITKKRFFSIVAIVFIGVAFMIGLMSSSDLMRDSVDVYNKELNLQDIQIYSNFGFCDEDIKALKELEYVDDVFPSKQLDSYCKVNGDKTYVSRIIEDNSLINKISLVDGRMPIANDEVVVLYDGDSPVEDYKGKAKIGDRLHLYNDDIISDDLSVNYFTVVGLVNSSEFLSKFLSSSNFKNLDLDFVIYANDEVFKSDYYSCIYLTLNDSQKFISGTDEYFEFINNKVDLLETFKEKQESYNRDKIISDAQKEIDDAKKELDDEIIDTQLELDDAKKELIDAWNKIVDGEKELNDGIAKLNDAQHEVDNGRKELNSGKNEINNAKKQIVDNLSVLPEYSGLGFDDINNSVKNSLNTYNTLVSSKDAILSIFPGGIAEIEAAISLETDPTNKASLIEYKTNLETIEYTLTTYFSSDVVSNLNILNTQLDQIIIGENDLKSGEKKLNGAQYEIDKGWIEIEESRIKLADGKKDYYDGKKEYEDGLKEFDEEVSKARKEIKDAENEIADFEDAKWTILDRDSHYSSYMYKNTCSQMKAIGIVLPLLFFLVAALVCSTTMTRLVDEQRGQNGVYSALGYPKSYITSKYLLYVFIASIIGTIPGIFAGMSLFPTVIYTTWRLMYLLPELIVEIPISGIVISFSSFSLLMMLVTFIVIKRSLIEKPAQLMRPKSPKASRGVFLEKISIIWNHLSFTSKITARNLIRYKSRFFMTVIGVAGCTGLLVLGFGIRDSISDVVNIQYKEIFNYDYTINLEEGHDYTLLDKNISKINDIDAYVPYTSYSTKVTFEDEKDKTITAIVINHDLINNVFNLTSISTNKCILDDSGVIISEKFAINNDLKVGDIILIESKDGTIKDVVISDICKMYFQHYLFISDNLYSSLFNEDIKYTNIAIKGYSDELFEYANLDSNIDSIIDFSGFIDQFNTMIEALDLIIAVVIITAGALALVVLFNLIQVNISERTREIATFKVLGFRNNEVNTYIFKEIVILTLFGAIAGLPLGKIEEKFVMNVINMEMIMFPNNIKFLSYVYSFIITMVFTTIVLLATIRPLKKINMIESLKSVE